MPVNHTTSLTFTATNQSLWGTGTATSFNLTTGNLMVFDPAEQTLPIDIDTYVLGGLSGTGYVDIKIGLVAYASLGTAGSFNTSLSLQSDVSYNGAVAAGGTMTFDMSQMRVGASSVTTEGFTGPSAGLDLVIAGSAGIRNMQYTSWFYDSDPQNVSFFNFDETINLIKIDTTSPLFEIPFLDGDIKITGRLPTGANLSGTANGETVVEAAGASETKFLELNADLDALLTRLLQKLPGPAAVVGKFLSETVFAEHEYDLADYISFLNEDEFTVSLTAVDIGASLGAVITEKAKVDFGGTGSAATPDVFVTLRSDNGTVGNTADDLTVSGFIGDGANSVFNLAAPLTGEGTANITATYELRNVTFTHSVGVGANLSFGIELLKADIFGYEVGPAYEVTLPEDGFAFDLFSHTFAPFNVAQNAFQTITDSFQVFYTNNFPSGFDFSAQNAVQQLYAYKQQQEQNLASSVSTFGQLWNNSAAVQNVIILAGNQQSTPVASHPSNNTAAFWLGDVQTDQFSLTQGAGVNNFVIADISGTSISTLRLGASMASSAGTEVVTSTSTSIGKLNFLNALSDPAVDEFEIFTLGISPNRYLRTTSAVEVKGHVNADVLVYYKPGTFAPTYFDGGGSNTSSLTVEPLDLFVADFLFTNANTLISLDLLDMRTANTAVQLGNGAILRGIETIYVKTGNADDYIATLGTKGEDFVSTNGGKDIVENRNDDANDQVRLGSGDDVAIAGFRALQNDGDDVFFGGTGKDFGVFTAVNGSPALSGLRLDLIYPGESNGLFASLGFADGLGSTDSSYRLLTVLDIFTNQTTVDQSAGFTHDALSQAVADREGIKLINGTTGNGTAIFHNDIEHVSVIGSSARDLVLFSGGLTYEGGDNFDDTLIADFGAYAGALNATTGVNLNAAVVNSRFGFGDATIGGFERFIVRATNFDDIFVAGISDDVFIGFDGDDFMNGGTLVDPGSDRDYLSGGGGNDTILWSNGSSDLVVDGVTGDFDVLNIDGLFFLSTGLVYDFQQISTVTYLQGGAGTDFSSTYYDAASSTDSLIEALGFINGGAPGTVSTAVSFMGDKANNAAYMNYSGIERVNITGGNGLRNDLLIYQNGEYYKGGESFTGSGDVDAFVADFTGQAVGINFNLGTGAVGTVVSDAAGKVLENGVLVSGIERAVLKAGFGNDALFGGDFDDYFDGGLGDDALYDGAGNDKLLGGAGEDFVLWDGRGTDDAQGGDDEDNITILGRNGALAVTFYNSSGADISGGAISAASTYEQMIAAVNAQPSAASFKYESGADSILYREFEKVDVIGTAANNDFVLYQGVGAYRGGEQAGDDDVFAGNLSAETQDLNIDLGATGPQQLGNGAIYDGFERLIVQLGLGDDTAIGGLGRDYIAGGGGGDYLANGGGTPASLEDKLLGDGGDDTLVYTGGRAWLDGGSGIRDLAIIQFNSANAITFDTIDINGNFINPNPYSAGAHVDRAYLLDFVNVGLTAPAVAGFAYNFDGSLSNDVKLFNVERINISGSVAADFLVGGASDNILTGNKGNDTLVSGGGNDVLSGGLGTDNYVFNGIFGSDVISGETLNAGIVYFLDKARADVQFSVNANDLFIYVASTFSILTIRNYFAPGLANGLNFTFDFTDFRGKVTTTPDGFATAGAVAGPTYNGTAGDDEVNQASAGANLVYGNDGNDIVHADAGNDTIDGGSGNDTVSFAHLTSGVLIDLALHIGQFAEAQGDVYLSIENAVGGQGNNTLRGSDGDNVLNGNDGIDDFDGGQGDDVLFGLGNNDTFTAGLGDDSVFGGDGNDTMYGDEGDDDLLGGGGNDTIYGDDDQGLESGNDRISGGAGNDTAFGEAGDDIYFYGGAEDPATTAHEDGFDTFDGGTGVNTVDLERFGSAVRINLTLSVNNVQTRDGTNMNTGTLRNLMSVSNVSNAAGTAFDDIFIGNSGANSFFGDLGSDVFIGGNGADTMDGGGGVDVYDGSQETGTTGGYLGTGGIFVDFTGAAPRVRDSFGNDDVITGLDVYIGSVNTDYFLMGADDDDVRGGGNGDYLDGGAGNDILEGGAGADNLIGGAGNGNVLSYLSSAAGVTIDILNNTASGGDAGGDLIQDFNHIFGSNLGDQLTGNGNNNLLAGGGGGDTLNGGGGEDQLTGDLGNDTLDGGADNDIMIGGGGSDTYFDNLGDTITEGLNQGNDTVNTTRNSYTLGPNLERVNFIGSGNFIGTGNSLANRFQGGTGDDRFVDVLGGADIFSGNAGTDTVDFRASATGAFINMATLVHGGAAAGDSYSGIEKFLGSNTGADTMTGGGTGRWVFTGGGGGDTLTGGIKNDQLLGQGGNDTLVGGADRDSLDGGTGNDTLTGGAAGDVFVFIDAAFGVDTITDYQDGLDSFKVFSAVADNIADFTITNNGTTSVTLTLGANTISINGAAPIAIAADDFVFY